MGAIVLNGQTWWTVDGLFFRTRTEALDYCQGK